MKRQTFSIRYIDHRKDPPVTRETTYQGSDALRKYLQAMARAMNPPEALCIEVTVSEVNVYPESRSADLFEEAKS